MGRQHQKTCSGVLTEAMTVPVDLKLLMHGGCNSDLFYWCRVFFGPSSSSSTEMFLTDLFLDHNMCTHWGYKHTTDHHQTQTVLHWNTSSVTVWLWVCDVLIHRIWLFWLLLQSLRWIKMSHFCNIVASLVSPACHFAPILLLLFRLYCEGFY